MSFLESDDIPVHCWELKCNYAGNRGYPTIWDGSKYMRANRFVLEHKLGRKLTDLEKACHHCDNVKCVNPHHLFVGSHLDNMRDMKAKGRAVSFKGSAHANAKLTEEKVRAIKDALANGARNCDVAKAFNVNAGTVSFIRSGKQWSHV